MATIVQLSDCHLFKDKSKPGYNDIKPYESLALLLQQVKQINPDCVVVTGDISGDDSEQSYHHFLDLFGQFKLLNKLKVIAGNHDQTASFSRLLSSLDLATCGPLVFGKWVIHGLDTRYQGTLGNVSDDDLDRLVNHIAAKPKSFHLVACHHHPVKVDSWMDKHKWLNRDRFVDQISHLPQVRLVIYGHIHSDQKTIVQGCSYQSSPSTCWQFGNTSEFSITQELPGFKVYYLQGDNKFVNATVRLQQQ